jgi:hypothetical protein
MSETSRVDAFVRTGSAIHYNVYHDSDYRMPSEKVQTKPPKSPIAVWPKTHDQENLEKFAPAGTVWVRWFGRLVRICQTICGTAQLPLQPFHACACGIACWLAQRTHPGDE